MLCPSTAASSPPQSSSFILPLLSLSIPLPVPAQCHLSNDILVFQLILQPLSATCASNSPSIIFHSGDVSSPSPFRIGYVSNYVCHSGSLPNGGATDSVFSLTFSIFLSMAHWLVSSFFTNGFVRDHVWHPYVIAGKTHWLKTFLFRVMGRCLSRKISLYFPKTFHPAFILIETSCLVHFSIAIVCPRYL